MELDEQERYIEYFKNISKQASLAENIFNIIKNYEIEIKLLEVKFSDTRYTTMELSSQSVINKIKEDFESKSNEEPKKQIQRLDFEKEKITKQISETKRDTILLERNNKIEEEKYENKFSKYSNEIVLAFNKIKNSLKIYRDDFFQEYRSMKTKIKNKK